MPTILNSLQRSVQAVLVGKIQIQDWFSNGIKKAALMHKWPLKEISVDEDDQCLLQNDGFFLYLLCKDGLYKIGSGYSGTVRVMWFFIVFNYSRSYVHAELCFVFSFIFRVLFNFDVIILLWKSW